MKARPSDAHRWCGGRCPGSVALSAYFPVQDSAHALEGTRLHAEARRVLRGEAVSLATRDVDVIGPYIADVQAAVSDAGRHRLDIETENSWSLRPGLVGTPDAALFDLDMECVTIWDLKTGWALVDVVENWQLICYALMLCPPKWTVDLRVAQSTAYHPDGEIRSWRLSWLDLLRYGVTVVDAYDEAMNTGALTRPGRHCLYCRALPGCKTARDVSLQVVEYAHEEPHELPDREIGRELAILREAHDLLKLRVMSLEETAEARMRRGKRLRGLSLAQGRGKRVWAQDAATTISALRMFVGTDYSSHTIGTPLQLSKQGVPSEILKSLTEHQPGKAKVAIRTDADVHNAFGASPDTTHIGETT